MIEEYIDFLTSKLSGFDLYRDFKKLQDIEIQSGIYILCYADHTFYVGKTNNIKRRLREHQRKIITSNIVCVLFKSFLDHLNTQEEVTIIKLLHEYDIPLRNTDIIGNLFFNNQLHPEYVQTREYFKDIMSEKEQIKWLYAPPIQNIDLDFKREMSAENMLNAKFGEKYYHENMIKITAFFLTNIPKLLETECNYWSLVFNLSYKNPFKLYVGMRRVLYFKVEKKNQIICYFAGCVTPELINKYGKNLVNIKLDYPNIEIVKFTYILNKKVRFDIKIDLDSMHHVLENPLFSRAIRLFILDCMQKNRFNKYENPNESFVSYLYEEINKNNFKYDIKYEKNITHTIKKSTNKENNQIHLL